MVRFGYRNFRIQKSEQKMKGDEKAAHASC